MSTISRSFELFYFILFIYFLYHYSRNKDWRTICELVSISLFALSLEFISIKIYEAYHYSPNFLIQIGSTGNNVPIVISLCWAMIIFSSMEITDVFNLDYKTKPFFDAILALNIDLSMDTIAIRIEGGFWSWDNYFENAFTVNSFAGVKYGNFIGWYFIVLIYSSLIRFERLKMKEMNFRLIQYLAVIPVIAYIPFYICFESIQQL